MNDATVKFGYDGRELYAGLAAQERRMRDSAGRVQSVFSRMGGNVSRMAGAVFGGATVAAITAFTKHALESFEGISDGAKRLNTSAEMYQRLGSVAKSNATDIETLGGALLRMRRQLQEDPAGDLAAGLEQAGIAATDFLRMDADQQLLQLADAFARAGENGNQLPLLTSALGKGYTELIPVLSQGRDALADMLAQSTAVSNTMIENAAEMNNRWDALISKFTLAGKVLAVGAAQGAAEMFGLMPRTQINAGGDDAKAAQREQEQNARRQAQRDAEAKAAMTRQQEAMKKIVDAQNELIQKKREALALEHINVEILELQAKGHDRLAEKARKHDEIRRRAQELSAMGLDANAAIALAKREQKAREDLDFRERTGRSKIGGVKNRRMMGFGGLDEFARMQQKVELPLDVRTPAGVRGARVGPDGHFYGGYAPVNTQDLASRGRRPGRMMGSESATGALSTRPAVSTSGAQAGTQASAGRENGNSVPDLLSKLIAVASRGFFGR